MRQRRVLRGLQRSLEFTYAKANDARGLSAARSVELKGVARDRLGKCATNAYCAVDARLANTPHNISRSLSHFTRKPARRGLAPNKKIKIRLHRLWLKIEVGGGCRMFLDKAKTRFGGSAHEFAEQRVGLGFVFGRHANL
jgi:hypothetical protein